MVRCGLILMALSLACDLSAQELRGADHHMHIRSENGSAVFGALCDAMPQACGEDFPGPPPPTGGADAIAVLDEAGLDKGVIMSIAYFYGFPELGDSEFADPKLVRAENRFVASEVARYPGRLYGLFSVNPLADYAIDEVRYWANQGSMQGLKLHLANSNLDFKNPEHVQRLRAVFEVLNEYGLAVGIHLRTRNPEYGAADAEVFINEVMPAAPDITLHLAHLAGWGGWDANTDSAIGAFLSAIGDGRLNRDHVWFDLAAVVIEQLPDAALVGLTDRLREIGLDRVLFATDWDATEDPKTHIETLRTRLGLSEDELEQVLENQAPYLH